jgi:hypothetical protein
VKQAWKVTFLGGLVVFGAIAFFTRWWSSPPAPAPATNVSAPAANSKSDRNSVADATVASTSAKSTAEDLSLLDHAKELARSSEFFSELSEPDRAWVLDHAVQSFKKKRIIEADFAQHIHELASIRRLAVLERTETLMPTMPFRSAR